MLVASLSDDALLHHVRNLPVAPRLLVDLGQALRHSRTHSSEITALLRQDTSLVARIIAMANGAAYGREEPVGSLEEALSCIGFREILRLVGVVAASQLANLPVELYGVDGLRLRENSVFVAVLMEEMAALAGDDPGEAYTVGLLRSIGKLALKRLARRESNTSDFAASGETRLDVWEEKTWGMTNCQMGARILELWRLPADTVLAIRHHYHPAGLEHPVIYRLHLAAGAAEQCGHGLPGEAEYWSFSLENFTQAMIDPGQYQTSLTRARKTFQRLQLAGG